MSLSTQKTDTLLNGELIDSVTKKTPMPFEGALSGAKDYLSKNPTILGMLLGGAGAGLTGGYLSSRIPQGARETKGGRRLRILRNALLAAGAGAGATGLAMSGAEQLNTALPKDDVDPATSFLTGGVPRTLATGAVGAGLLHHGISAEDAPRRGILASMVDSLKKKDKGLAAKVDDSLNVFNPKGEALRETMYHDLLSEAQSGGLKGINQKPLLDKMDEAGGLRNYDPNTLEHWGEQLKRLKNRMFGTKFGPKALVAGGGLGAAVMAPELIGSLFNKITGTGASNQ